MARASKIATKPKKKTVRVTRRGVNRFALAPIEDWNKTKHYVHYEIESKEWGEKVRDYIRKNYDRKILSSINRLPEWRVNNYSHWACTAFLLEANPEIVHEAYKTGIVKWVEGLAQEGQALAAEKQQEETAKKNVYTPTIQERIREQVETQAEAIEEWLEGFITDRTGFDPAGFDFKAHFARTGVTQAHARKLKSFYEHALDDFRDLERMPTAVQLKKMNEHEADQWAQLKEGYNHLKKADIAKYTVAVNSLMEALDFVIEKSKVTRKPRVAKPKSADKLVSKLKYLKIDNKYKLTSINPTEIVGASELWVFNVKTRKLGKYVAANIDPKGMAREGTGLSIKGTTIEGFDENLSVQKTLRKPEEQLKDFKAAGKVKLRKYLEEIATTETKLNGRINIDTVILKTG
jgi:hypothetical protein